MPISTVNISFQKDFLYQIYQFARNESRTRSELIREAVRVYIGRRQEIEKVFKLGAKIGATLDISEADVMDEVKAYRKRKKNT